MGTADDAVVVPDSSLELTDLEDVANDSANGDLLLLDAADQSVFRITPGATGDLDGATPSWDDGVSLT